ncbi:hypothetical protein LWM68_09640 [Niabella sp. W65]|nr:hypothetical protein [Niabella sp. W65]MCH7363006.1 hypothetical protein [Niabella sp. W65]
MEAGFSRVRIRPQPASVREADIKVPTIRGNIIAAFTNQPGQSFSLEVTIPANATAELWLPLPGKKNRLLLDGKEQKFVERGGFAVLNSGSGNIP